MLGRCGALPPVVASTSNAPLFFSRRQKQWLVNQWARFERWQDLEREQKAHEAQVSRERNFIRFPLGMYLTPEKPDWVRPKKALEDQNREERGVFSMDTLTNHSQLRYVDHSVDNIARVQRYKHFTYLQYDQRFLPERLIFLGPDIAAAHFLVHRGAAVKFVGDNAWYKKDKKGKYSLPGRKVPGLYLEAIDASGTELMYEGFDNLYDLTKMRMLRMAGCQYVDDWTLGRIGAIFGPTLEMLDLSGCHRISAKGLMGLRTCKNLRYLRLEGLDDIKNIGKAVVMLEEALPHLTVLGVDLDEDLKRLEADTALGAHDRVLEDARGNMFAEDDRGRLFYVSGRVDEHVVVDDDDFPLITSTIRRETPQMTDAEFEELDRLSHGKLRHLLVGSPSGLTWSSTTETILQHEAKLRIKDGIPLDPKLLPRSWREKSKQERLKLPKQAQEALARGEQHEQKRIENS